MNQGERSESGAERRDERIVRSGLFERSASDGELWGVGGAHTSLMSAPNTWRATSAETMRPRTSELTL